MGALSYHYWGMGAHWFSQLIRRHNRHQQNEDCLCHLNIKLQRKLTRLKWPMMFSLINLCYKSLSLYLLTHIIMPNGFIPKVAMFPFSSTPNASRRFICQPRSPFTRRLGLVFNATNWQRLACSSLTTSSSREVTLCLHAIMFRVPSHWVPAAVFTL